MRRNKPRALQCAERNIARLKSQSERSRRRVRSLDRIVDSHDSIVRSNWDPHSLRQKSPVLNAGCTGGWLTSTVGNVENLRRLAPRSMRDTVFDDTTEFDRAVAAEIRKGVLRASRSASTPHHRFERIDVRRVLILDDIGSSEISLSQRPVRSGSPREGRARRNGADQSARRRGGTLHRAPASARTEAHTTRS